MKYSIAKLARKIDKPWSYKLVDFIYKKLPLKHHGEWIYLFGKRGLRDRVTTSKIKIIEYKPMERPSLDFLNHILDDKNKI